MISHRSLRTRTIVVLVACRCFIVFPMVADIAVFSMVSGRCSNTCVHQSAGTYSAVQHLVRSSHCRKCAIYLVIFELFYEDMFHCHTTACLTCFSMHMHSVNGPPMILWERHIILYLTLPVEPSLTLTIGYTIYLPEYYLSLCEISTFSYCNTYATTEQCTASSLCLDD